MSGTIASMGIAAMPERPAAHYTRIAACVEDLGFSCLWIPDERFWRDISVCLTVAVAAARTLRIGCAVTDPYIRHPALTAQIFATVDELSEGRTVCGIGAGVAGFEALGIQRLRPARAIREAVELMRALWGGESVEYEGETLVFRGALDFTPVRPDIPVYVAGRGPQILTLAGEIGDGAMIGSLACAPGLDFALARIDRGLLKRAPTRAPLARSLWLHTAISDDPAEAEEAVRTIVTGVLVSSARVIDSWGIQLPHHLMDALEGVTYGLASPSMQRVRGLVDSSVIQHFAVAGDAQHVAGRLRALTAAGIDHIAVLPWLVPGQSLESFASTLARAASP